MTAANSSLPDWERRQPWAPRYGLAPPRSCRCWWRSRAAIRVRTPTTSVRSTRYARILRGPSSSLPAWGLSARATVGILEGLGLAAAVIDRRGRVIASNGLLDKQDVVVPTAFGGVALSNRVKNASFAQALSRTGDGTHGPCLSIPLTATDTDPALIVHLLPLRGLANDLFSGGHVLMVVSPVVRKAVPQPELLYGLFDLTPAEARLTLSLLEGGALPEIAVRTGVSHHTLRTQLRSVMAKTGTRRQAELTQLLASL